jgi:hypothetical protein
MRRGPVARSVAAMPAIQAIRGGALWAHLGLAVLVVAGVFAQVYLIGAYIFGAGPEALDAHRTVGFTVHGFEVLILLAALVAWLPRADLGLSLLMAVGGTVQLALAAAVSGRARCTRSARCSCSSWARCSSAATYATAAESTSAAPTRRRRRPQPARCRSRPRSGERERSDRPRS